MQKKPKKIGSSRKSQPVYQQLADSIRQRIEAGEFSVGDRLPSTKQFSEDFNVNHLTARQALKVLESESLITMHAGRGSFVCSAKIEAGSLAVMVPSLGQRMPAEISRGIRSTLNGDNELSIIFLDYHEDAGFEKDCLERLSSGFDGAIYYPSLAPLTIRPMLELISSGFPVVFIDRAITGVPVWLVSSNNREMGEMAARHLIEAGVKHPACVMTAASHSVDRLHGFRVELNNGEIALPANRVALAPPEGDPGGLLTRRLLSLKKRPDAIFYDNDYQALIGMKVIQEAGLNVPGDVKVIGCDDIDAAHLANPPLSSVYENFGEVGSRALKMVRELMQLPVDERFQSRQEIVGVDLKARESTASKPGRSSR
jgi:GntR family transcriptional regulator, arabinose operon transcriptional repressor